MTAKKFFSVLSPHPSVLALLSGVLLTLSFPRFPFGFLAWIALVPFLFSAAQSPSRFQALVRGFLTGAVFFGLSLHWLTYVSGFGWIFVAFILESSFMVLFALMVYEGRGISSSLMRPLWIALAWTSTEFLRGEIPVFGLGWNLLAYSQAPYAWILQSANTVGAYGLGFVIAWVNGIIFELAIRAPRAEDRDQNSSQSHSLIFRGSRLAVRGSPLLLIFLALFSHGFYQSRPVAAQETVRISVVQGNIAQEIKWETVAREKIIELYTKLTDLAHYDEPDLILWPEASFPGYFNRDLSAEPVRTLAKDFQIPLLVGAPYFEEPDMAFNSAYLVGPDGEIKKRYDKQYLVPFGEYVPLPFIFGWLEPLAYSLGVSDFSAGREATVFEMPESKIPFSVLICFEDIFGELARRFTGRGARFLIVMTNDAWFGPTSAPHQHLQASVFRAVENGVPVVRAANTGVSAFISARGKVLGRVKRGEDDTFVTGHLTLDLPLNASTTLYRHGGWIFPYVAFAAFVIMFAVDRSRK